MSRYIVEINTGKTTTFIFTDTIDHARQAAYGTTGRIFDKVKMKYVL